MKPLAQLSPEIGRTAEDEMLRVVNEYSGRRFPSMSGLGRRWLVGRARRAPHPDEIFCAELVAMPYQRLGLVESKRPPNWYDPGRFWSGDRISLSNDFASTSEIEVRVE